MAKKYTEADKEEKRQHRSDTRRTILGTILFRRTMITLLLMALQFGIILYMIYAIQTRGHHWIVGGSYVLSMGCVVYLINLRIKEEFKIAWIIPLCLFPVFGLFMYIFVLVNPGTRLLRNVIRSKGRAIYPLLSERKEQTDKIAEENEHIGSLVHYLYYSGGHPAFTDTKVTYFPLGEDFFSDLISQLKTATKFIYMEFFIINEGIMLDSVLEILKKKVKEGVEVKFMFDGTNTVTTVPYNYDKKLREMGIEAKVFAQVVPFLSTHQNNRDHRKIVVIDGRIAYTGGINLSDEYINVYEKHGHWKDIAIRMDGPGVSSFTTMFLHMWNLTEAEDVSYEEHVNVPMIPALEKGYVIPYNDDAVNSEDIAENIYLYMLNKAHKYVYMMSPYFAVDSEMVSAITFAAKRGIDVRLILPGIPDKKMPYYVARSYYRTLLAAGVKVYEYKPGFVHAKMFVSDDTKACVGSVNLDYRSLYHHFECGAFIYMNDEIIKMRDDFLKTQKQCIEVTEEYYESLGFFNRVLGRIFRTVAPLI